MKREDVDGHSDPAIVVSKFLAQRWNWLARALIGQTVLGDVRIEGVSVRFDSTGCMVVVRGLSLDAVRYVVAFGRGERLYEALRNVTSAINKGEWKPDRYKSMH